MTPKTIIASFLLAAQATAAPITFNTALPVAKEDYVIRLISSDSTMENDSESRLDVSNISFIAAYGIDSDLAFYAAIPILEKRYSSAGRVLGTNGLGDTRLFARQTLWQHDRRGATSRLATFGGIEVPTGKNDISDANGLLPRPSQLGSGAWDTFLGFVFTHQEFGWQVDLSTTRKIQGTHEQFKAGNETRLDLSLQKRMLPHTLVDDDWKGFLYGVVELNALWSEKAVTQGNLDIRNGGEDIASAIGVQYITRSWILETAYKFPVSHTRHTNAMSLEKGIVLSLRRNF